MLKKASVTLACLFFSATGSGWRFESWWTTVTVQGDAVVLIAITEGDFPNHTRCLLCEVQDQFIVVTVQVLRNVGAFTWPKVGVRRLLDFDEDHAGPKAELIDVTVRAVEHMDLDPSRRVLIGRVVVARIAAVAILIFTFAAGPTKHKHEH